MNHPVVVDQDVVMSLSPPKWLAVWLHQAWKEICLDHPGCSYGTAVAILKNRMRRAGVNLPIGVAAHE